MVFQSTKTTTTTTNKIIYRIIMKSANHYFSFFFVRKIRLMYPFVSIRSSLMLETTPFEENVRPFAPTFPRNSPPRLALTMNLHFTCRRRSSSLSFTSSSYASPFAHRRTPVGQEPTRGNQPRYW